jgi:hypothetical protein
MFLPSVAMRTPPPQPVAVATVVGLAPHLPATQAAPASHFVPHIPQLSGSTIFETQAAVAPVPQMSGVSDPQAHILSLQAKPVPGQSVALVQAIPVPPPVPVPLMPPEPLAVPPVAMPPEPLVVPPEELPPLGGGGVVLLPPLSVDEQAKGKSPRAQNGIKKRGVSAIPHLMSARPKSDRPIGPMPAKLPAPHPKSR